MSQADRQLVDALEGCKNAAVAIAADINTGPITPIYAIEHARLQTSNADGTEALKQLISAIMSSAGVYDKAANIKSNSDDTFGAMRSPHGNSRKHLPKHTNAALTNLQSRGKVVSHYVQTNKEPTAQHEEAGKLTGYIEYTAHDDAYFQQLSRKMRIVFDYIKSRIFLSPLHYHSWALKGADNLDLKEPADVVLGDPNPFYWIIEVRTKI